VKDGITGHYNAIALWYDTDSNPYPHISYRMDEGEGKGLWTAWKDPDPTCRLNPGWSLLPLDTSQEGRGAWTSIAIQQFTDPVGAWIHVSYTDIDPRDRMIFYSLRSQCDVRVTLETVDDQQDLGTFGTDIAVSPNDSTICIVYYDEIHGALKYAEKKYPSGPWKLVTVDDGGNVGKYPAIAIGSDGVRHVSYYDETNGNLKYATCPGNCTVPSSWFIGDVDATDDVGLFTEIAVDPFNRPHISYIDATNSSLKYAALIGFWRTITVDLANDFVASTSIGIGSGNSVHISYSDRTNNTLNYTNCYAGTNCTIDPTTWNKFPIPDSWDDVGLWNSIAVSDEDTVHISYSATHSLCSFRALKYAKGKP
jgi:hypothetical protein